MSPTSAASVAVAPIGTRWLRWAGGSRVTVLRELPDAPGEVELRLSELLVELAGLSPTERRDVVDAVVLGCGDDPDASSDLRRVRDALRDRHPHVVVGADGPRGCSVEVLARVDAHTWYVRGWIGRPRHELTSMVLVSPLGERVELGSTAARYARSDVDRFYGLAPHRGADGLGVAAVGRFAHAAPPVGWLLEVTGRDGSTQELTCPDALAEPTEVRRLLLGELALDEMDDDRVLTAVLHDALQRTEEARRATVELDHVDVHGTPPEDPDVTVVVPLYGRLDFLEHQLAQFVHDPAMAASDLVWVLDQPEHADAFRAEARRLHRLYGVPFRLATVTANGGFSVANNLGAGLARGRLLLLCNSDILPNAPGWLPQLVHFHDHLPAVGAVSPKLVFEDGSLQHAGMYFERPAGEALWSNEHYFKGLRRDFAPACVSRPVPAVTAACLLTDRRLFEDLGGLRGQFLQGDFEDSDYCLRLRTAGRDVWYAADVELLHLEGMSYPNELRAAVGRYNKWLHTQLWDGVISDIMADPSVRPGRVAAELAGPATSDESAGSVGVRQ